MRHDDCPILLRLPRRALQASPSTGRLGAAIDADAARGTGCRLVAQRRVVEDGPFALAVLAQERAQVGRSGRARAGPGSRGGLALGELGERAQEEEVEGDGTLELPLAVRRRGSR